MSDNTKLKISNGLNEDKYSVKSKFVNFFLLAMFTLFPLFYTDYYYNIRHDKYYFFLVVTAVLVLMIGAVAITNSDSQSGTKDKAEVIVYGLCIWCIHFGMHRIHCFFSRSCRCFLGSQRKKQRFIADDFLCGGLFFNYQIFLF